MDGILAIVTFATLLFIAIINFSWIIPFIKVKSILYLLIANLLNSKLCLLNICYVHSSLILHQLIYFIYNSINLLFSFLGDICLDLCCFGWLVSCTWFGYWWRWFVWLSIFCIISILSVYYSFFSLYYLLRCSCFANCDI